MLLQEGGDRFIGGFPGDLSGKSLVFVDLEGSGHDISHRGLRTILEFFELGLTVWGSL